MRANQENILWLTYCVAVKEHHQKQTLESLKEVLAAHEKWRKEFLRG